MISIVRVEHLASFLRDMTMSVEPDWKEPRGIFDFRALEAYQLQFRSEDRAHQPTSLATDLVVLAPGEAACGGEDKLRDRR